MHAALVPALDEHVKCFDSLVAIVQLLQLQDGVLRYLPKLRCAIEEHRARYTGLYPDSCIPKGVHFYQHIPRQIEEHGVSMSCFAPERAHKVGKGKANK
eukprot:1411921-Karenia_brevis.AAC.1